MSKTWKWILGILLVLVVIGAFVAVGFAWRMHAVGIASYRSLPLDRNWNGPMMGRGNDGWNQPGMMQRDGGWGHPMMYDHGFRPRGGGFFLLGGLVKLILFLGLLYFAYWLGRRNARFSLDPVAATPVAEVPTPKKESTSASPEGETSPAPSKRAKKTE